MPSHHWPVNIKGAVANHWGPGFSFESMDVNAAIDYSLIDHGVMSDVDCIVDDGDIAGRRHDHLFDAGAEKQRHRDKRPGIRTDPIIQIA
jgi:hypothetical protein